jgi:hypothetical protein
MMVWALSPMTAGPFFAHDLDDLATKATESAP